MNTYDIDFKFLVENDNNPIIIFNHSGHIIYINSNAEILMSYVKVKDIFDLALNNASKDYGSKTVQIELNYGHLKFYAINVSYINDDWIAIRLYYRAREKMLIETNKQNYTLTNLNKLLDIAIIQFKIESKTDIKLFTDQDIPKTLINQNDFLKLLRVILSQFKVVSCLDISLKFAIGEHIIIDGKRYFIINLEFKSSGRYCNEDKIISELGNKLCIVTQLSEDKIFLEIPLIKD